MSVNCFCYVKSTDATARKVKEKKENKSSNPRSLLRGKKRRTYVRVNSITRAATQDGCWLKPQPASTWITEFVAQDIYDGSVCDWFEKRVGPERGREEEN